jgi:hypothetical protein
METIKKIQQLEAQRDACIGVLGIVRFRVLDKQIQALRRHTERVKVNRPIRRGKTLVAACSKVTKRRLFPELWYATNFHRVMTPKHAQCKRQTHKTRVDLIYQENNHKSKETSNLEVEERETPVDVCPKCTIALIVDKETSRTICPSCGDSRTLAFHVFDVHEWDKEDLCSSQTGASSSHLHQYCLQFKNGFPQPTVDTMANLTIHLQKIHTHDLSRVQRSCLVEALKTTPGVSPHLRRSTDRLFKELRGEPIPEFSQMQLIKLLHQKNRLQATRDLVSGEQSTGERTTLDKSFNNQMYMRHFGIANGMQNAQLFPHAKTVKNHRTRCNNLEAACLQQATSVCANNKSMRWVLAPFS